MSTPPYLPSTSEGEPSAATATPESSDAIESPPGRAARIIIWAVLSTLIVIYIAFGSITTRFWELDVFQQAWTQKVASRKVFHVWMYQLDHLPYSSSPALLKLAFGGALLAVVLGVVMSIWLILYQGSTSAAGGTSVSQSLNTDAS